MVQVFGNRILGGIGAPGGGMSESFGAGVSTALNQRASRQAMVGEGQRQSILAQEQAFRIEDRAAAKKRQAAAEAAAATARARAAGLATTYQSIYGAGGSTAAGLDLGAPRVAPSGLDNVPVGGLPAKRPTAAPAVNISADARPAASGAVNIPPVTPISGGAGGGVTGGAGSDTLGVTGPSFETRGRGQAGVAVSPTTLGQMSSARPGSYQAQAGLRNLATTRSMDAELAQTGRGIIPAFMVAQQELDDAQAAFAQDPSGENLQRVTAATDELNRLTPLAREASASLRRYTDRGVLAEEGAGSSGAARLAGEAAAPTVTIEGPNGPVTVPTISAVAEPGAGGTLALATAGAAGAEGFEQRYGPSLGAPTRTPEEAEVDEFVASSGVNANAEPPPTVGKPGPLNKAVTDLLSMREKQVRWAQALIDAGQYEDARAVQNEITSIDAKLGAVVARQALAEARDYYAPQRLNAIWSEYERRNFEFVPTAEGIYDVYVDGQLQFPGMSMEQITKDTLAMTDQVYAEQQAALAQKEAEAFASARGTAEANYPFDLQTALDAADIAVTRAGLEMEIEVGKDMRLKLNDVTKQQIEAALRAEGILPEQAREFKYIETTEGGVQVFDGPDLIVEYVPEAKKRQDGSTFVTLAPVNQ